MSRPVWLAFVALAVSLATTLPAQADPPSLQSKRAEASRILAEVQELDVRLERSVEAFNLARIKLSVTERQLHENRRELVVARSNLRRAQRTLAVRVVYLYTEDGPPSIAEILLGAGSVGDALDLLDLERRVAAEDTQVLGEVRVFRAEVVRQRQQLRRARRTQAHLVADLATRRSAIEARLGERRRLLSSIKAELARLRAAERASQVRLRRDAEARLAEEAPAQAQSVLGIAAELPEGVAVAPSTRHGHVVAIAMQYLGIPYLWGGASPETGFDCSGFVMYVYGQVGVYLPHNAALQYGYGLPVARDELQPGDIVFFNNLGHNGIYIGGGQFIQAPRTGDFVKISSLSESWYASTYVGARRLP